MRFLLDSNCWLQLIREREHAQSVRDLIVAVTDSRLATTDLALHSIIIVMQRFKMLDKVPGFLQMSRIGTSVELVRTTPSDLIHVAEVCSLYRLDIEDAYQYVAAEMQNLILVSLDADFDRTPRGRLTPAAALAQYQADSGARTPPQP